MKHIVLLRGFLAAFVFSACGAATMHAQDVLYKSQNFTLYGNKVVQGAYEAKAVSAQKLQSNYRSTASEMFPRQVMFKFSINEKDNEMPFGQNHQITIGAEHVTEVITFGSAYRSGGSSATPYLPSNYTYTFLLDGREVLKQLNLKGYYTAADDSKIARADFKGFYIAGNAEPLSWDFVNLDEKNLKLQDPDGDGIFEITVTFNKVDEAAAAVRYWQPVRDVLAKPVYASGQPIVDALYSMSVDEALIAIEADSTFRTGAKWAGVWTRDISYSILLAFAYHQPDVAKISLMKKVKQGRIVQDTGSGGAWPVSSDRTTWILAAWEVYKVTGDLEWLKQCYPVIKHTLEDDHKTLQDPATGMYRGESSFLDWREQTYPRWMDNADIFASENLGTNAVHYQAHMIAAEMAAALGEDGAIYAMRALAIKEGINRYLWQEAKGYYGQYLYGRSSKVLSGRYEALGEALSILFDVADEAKAKSVVSRSPLTEYGATCIYPQIPGIPAYHNNAIWPFVQAYWNLAAAKAGNETVLNHGLAALYRAGALFLTNYENFVASNGDYVGTEVNSDHMLWSMAGNLAMVHRVFMGMEFKPDGIAFHPAVPKSYDGVKRLSSFRYRNAILDITVKGYGNVIAAVTIDGKQADAFFSGSLSGNHSVVIEMANQHFEAGMNLLENTFSVDTPQVKLKEGKLIWPAVAQAEHYIIYRNGKEVTKQEENIYAIRKNAYGDYRVAAAGKDGQIGFTSEPLVYAKNAAIIISEAEKFAPASSRAYSNFSGSGFVALSKAENTAVVFEVSVPQDGNYLIDFRYSNGNGPWNTDNKCAIRSLYTNGTYTGVVVMSQRGQDEWSDWGYSNLQSVPLKKGRNQLQLAFKEWNNNMNFTENTAMLDYCRIIKL